VQAVPGRSNKPPGILFLACASLFACHCWEDLPHGARLPLPPPPEPYHFARLPSWMDHPATSNTAAPSCPSSTSVCLPALTLASLYPPILEQDSRRDTSPPHTPTQCHGSSSLFTSLLPTTTFFSYTMGRIHAFPSNYPVSTNTRTQHRCYAVSGEHIPTIPRQHPHRMPPCSSSPTAYHSYCRDSHFPHVGRITGWDRLTTLLRYYMPHFWTDSSLLAS